jgi:hypothetical protein
VAKDDKLKENTGAWIVHHGRKLSGHVRGRAEFPAIDVASQAATLLVRLGETNDGTLSRNEVRAVAIAAGLNPNYELSGLLEALEKKRLIDQSSKQITLLGVTTRGALTHAVELFEEAGPTSLERASIDLAERVSASPLRRTEASELIADTYRIATSSLIRRRQSASSTERTLAATAYSSTATYSGVTTWRRPTTRVAK